MRCTLRVFHPMRRLCAYPAQRCRRVRDCCPQPPAPSAATARRISWRCKRGQQTSRPHYFSSALIVRIAGKKADNAAVRHSQLFVDWVMPCVMPAILCNIGFTAMLFVSKISGILQTAATRYPRGTRLSAKKYIELCSVGDGLCSLLLLLLSHIKTRKCTIF